MEDGDLVNPSERAAHGRKEVAELFADEHTTYMAKTTFSYQPTSIRFIRPDVAIVEKEAVITGMLDDTGTPMPQTRFAVFTVMSKDPLGNWNYVAVRPRSQ